MARSYAWTRYAVVAPRPPDPARRVPVLTRLAVNIAFLGVMTAVIAAIPSGALGLWCMPLGILTGRGSTEFIRYLGRRMPDGGANQATAG